MPTTTLNTAVLLAASHTGGPGGHSGGGMLGSLANTFAHAAAAAFAWHGVSAPFRSGHGIGLLLAAGIAIVVAVYFLRRRRKS